MQLFHNLTTLLSLIEISGIGQQFGHIVQNICLATATEQDFRTFIYMSSDGASSDNPNVPLILQKLRIQNPIAVINIDAHTPVARYRDQFNHKLLSIVQLTRSQNAARDEEVLLSLWQRLHQNRKSKLILFFGEDASEEYLMQILQFCAIHRAINVIALHPHYALREHIYHILEIFPVQKTIRRAFSPSYRAIFSNHLENMHGQPLRLFEMKWYPQIYNYTPKGGPTILSGYIGRALVEYTNRRNGTIGHIPLPASSTAANLFYPGTRRALDNNISDIGQLFPIQIMHHKASSSKAVYHTSFCLMVPVEKQLPKITFYYIIIKKCAFVLFCLSLALVSCIVSIISRWEGQQQIPLMDYFINLSLLQGLLGMPFWTNNRISTILKFICIVISLAGIIIGTAYGTYLQSFTVDAPLEQYAENIGDLLKRGIKVAIYTDSLQLINSQPKLAKYIQNFTLFNNISELLMLEGALDTRYAFMVTDMWTTYDEQQKFFSRPLFRISDICFWKDIPMGLPLQDDSVYYDDINQLFSKLNAAGLVGYWLRHSFVELVAMNVIQLEDRNKKPGFVPLTLEDLYGVFGALGVLIMLSIFCFVLEIFWVIIRSLQKMVRNLVRKIVIERVK